MKRVALVLVLIMAFASCEPKETINCKTVIEKTFENGKFTLVFADKSLVVGGREYSQAVVGKNWCTDKH